MTATCGPSGTINLDHLERRKSTFPVLYLFSLVMKLAIKHTVHRVTFEPRNEELRLTFSIGDAAHEITPPPAHLHRAIAGVVKSAFGLIPFDENSVQTGHLLVMGYQREIQLTATTQPGSFGEGIVIEIHDAAPPEATEIDQDLLVV